MSIITDLKRRIRNNEERISKTIEANSKLRQELAEMACPYELGDKVILSRARWDSGKREVHVITSIRPMSTGCRYKIGATRLKGDGSLYIRETTVTNPQGVSRYE